MEIRGGKGNGLLGKYFHDSGLAITLTDALFDLNYVAMTLGTAVESGSTTLYESTTAGETVGAGGVVTLAHTPVAFEGSTFAWYKKHSDTDWTVKAVTGTTLTIDGASQGDTYCIKYFYHDDSAKKVVIKVDRVPSVVHLVILNDLFAGDPAQGNANRWGRLITDIPSFQFNGSQDLSLTSTSAATVSLTGTALAVDTSDSCEEELIYGTMTQEQVGADWRKDAIALAVVNSNAQLKSGEKDTPIVYAVFGGNMASARKANSYFTFTKTGSGFTVDATTGEITATGTGSGTIEVAIKASSGETFKAEPATIKVTVTQ